MTLISSHNGEHETGRCDSKCYNATGPDCDCICGGINHGVGLKQAHDNMVAYVDAWRDKWLAEHPGETVDVPEKSLQLMLF